MDSTLADLAVLITSYLLLLVLSLSKGPATKQDLALVGFAIVMWLALMSLRSNP